MLVVFRRGMSSPWVKESATIPKSDAQCQHAADDSYKLRIFGPFDIFCSNAGEPEVHLLWRTRFQTFSNCVSLSKNPIVYMIFE